MHEHLFHNRSVLFATTFILTLVVVSQLLGCKRNQSGNNTPETTGLGAFMSVTMKGTTNATQAADYQARIESGLAEKLRGFEYHLEKDISKADVLCETAVVLGNTRNKQPEGLQWNHAIHLWDAQTEKLLAAYLEEGTESNVSASTNESQRLRFITQKYETTRTFDQLKETRFAPDVKKEDRYSTGCEWFLPSPAQPHGLVAVKWESELYPTVQVTIQKDLYKTLNEAGWHICRSPDKSDAVLSLSLSRKEEKANYGYGAQTVTFDYKLEMTLRSTLSSDSNATEWVISGETPGVFRNFGGTHGAAMQVLKENLHAKADELSAALTELPRK